MYLHVTRPDTYDGCLFFCSDETVMHTTQGIDKKLIQDNKTGCLGEWPLLNCKTQSPYELKNFKT